MPYKLRRGSLTSALLHNPDNLCACLVAGCVGCSPDLPGRLVVTLSGYTYRNGAFTVPLHPSGHLCRWELLDTVGTQNVYVSIYRDQTYPWSWHGSIGSNDTSVPDSQETVYIPGASSPTQCDPTGTYSNGEGQTAVISWP
jgi:hypothetical protein